MNPFKRLTRNRKPKPEPIACICPNCHQEVLRHKNVARKVGGTVGALAGAASGVSGILSAARIGMAVGAPTGPAGAVLTAVAAATLRGIVGATVGAELGTAMGSLIDRHVLENDACQHCGFPFASGMRGAPMSPMRPMPTASTSAPFDFDHRGPQEDIDFDEDDEPHLGPDFGPDAPRYPVLV